MSNNNFEIQPTSKKKKPAVAALLSVMFGGGGQIYLGQVTKGIIVMALVYIGSFLIVGVVLWPIAIYDAYILAKKIENGETIGEWEFFWSKSNSSQVSQKPSKWQVVDIVLTEKTESYIGEDKRIIDNSKSEIGVTRRFTESRDWTQTYVVEYEKTRNKTYGGSYKVAELINVQNSVSTILRSKYTSVEETKRTYTEDVTLQIPAYKKVGVIIQWKNIWQHGIVILRDQHNVEIEVPFKILDNVNFDQSQIDAG